MRVSIHVHICINIHAHSTVFSTDTCIRKTFYPPGRSNILNMLQLVIYLSQYHQDLLKKRIISRTMPYFFSDQLYSFRKPTTPKSHPDTSWYPQYQHLRCVSRDFPPAHPGHQRQHRWTRPQVGTSAAWRAAAGWTPAGPRLRACTGARRLGAGGARGMGPWAVFLRNYYVF